MASEIPKRYNPHDVEHTIYDQWEQSGYFNPDNLPKEKTQKTENTPFTIVIPPPNITGSLHMGHALNAAIQDVLIRKKRMEGYRTLWLPGTDHAGIATQNVVEKQLRREGKTRHDIGREAFLNRIWEWKEQYGNTILGQLKKLGTSLDWSRSRFTMDETYQHAVKEAFVHYYKKGWIYRAEKVINWCPRCATSLSDLELEYTEITATLYYITYPIKDSANESITVATVRPETMLGDAAVAVHPDDERYKHLVGKNAVLPIHHREIPIVADERVEKEFGTGAVKVTPAHDLLDEEIGETHGLPSIRIINKDGVMTHDAGSVCEGKSASECRSIVIEKLKEEGALEKEEPYTHNVAQCYRCDTTIEPMPSMQWFLKMQDLAKKAVDVVRTEQVRFHPKRWEKVYFDWFANIKDWTISRQIWWGHRIPAYFCKNNPDEFVVAPEKPDQCTICNNCEMEQSPDVLDTWFSSALWPFATLGWPDNESTDVKQFYPTTVLSTARDIINLWVARMIFSGIEFLNKKPFTDVIIHATILTRDGKRMSKSLGTGIDPMNYVSEYGADATRFGLIWQAMGNQDIHWAEEHIVAGQKFLTKIWNASRFSLMMCNQAELEDQDYNELQKIAQSDNLTDAEAHILQKLDIIKETANRHIEQYEFGHALHEIYEFFWHVFCDVYIEAAKKEDTKQSKQILLYVLAESLKLMHPFIPHITEHLWSMLPLTNKTLLMLEDWPYQS